MRRFDHQVAGHDSLLVIDDDSSVILKPVGPKEEAFYENSRHFGWLKDVIPSFYGITEQTGTRLAKLENLLLGFEAPSIADIKIGKRLHDDDCLPEKAERMIKLAESTTTASLGLRFCGIKVWNEGHYCYYDKKYGKELNSETIGLGLEKFIPSNNNSLLIQFSEELHRVISAMKRTNGRFYSSSILLIYSVRPVPVAKARLIDFAHSVFDETLGQDAGLLEGLENLLHLFESKIKQN